MTDEEVLQGGIANAGAVVRAGAYVLRPRSPHAHTIDALLAHVRATGFDGAPTVVDTHPDGRERLVFIPGDVPCPPYPAWSLTDDVLASTTSLIRKYHDATIGFVPPAGATWSDEMHDPQAGDVICHNDVCPENVVFRDGVAVALLDFDFAAPGRRTFDLVRFARMWIPIDAPDDAARTGRGDLDQFARLRVVADAYGLPPDRTELLDVMAEQLAEGPAFLLRHVRAGHEAFIKLWNDMGGEARYERRHAWFISNRQRFADALE